MTLVRFRLRTMLSSPQGLAEHAHCRFLMKFWTNRNEKRSVIYLSPFTEIWCGAENKRRLFPSHLFFFIKMFTFNHIIICDILYTDIHTINWVCAATKMDFPFIRQKNRRSVAAFTAMLSMASSEFWCGFYEHHHLLLMDCIWVYHFSRSSHTHTQTPSQTQTQNFTEREIWVFSYYVLCIILSFANHAFVATATPSAAK